MLIFATLANRKNLDPNHVIRRCCVGSWVERKWQKERQNEWRDEGQNDWEEREERREEQGKE